MQLWRTTKFSKFHPNKMHCRQGSEGGIKFYVILVLRVCKHFSFRKKVIMNTIVVYGTLRIMKYNEVTYPIHCQQNIGRFRETNENYYLNAYSVLIRAVLCIVWIMYVLKFGEYNLTAFLFCCQFQHSTSTPYTIRILIG